MRIVQVDITEDALTNFDDARRHVLVKTPLRMSRLKNIVLVAGPNGAGKTRLFATVRWLLDASSAMAGYSAGERERHVANYETARSQVSPPWDDERLEVLLNGNPWISQSKRQWRDWLTAQAVAIHSYSSIKTHPEDARGTIVNFVPKEKGITDQGTLTEATKANRARLAEELGFSDPAQSTSSYIHLTFKRAFDATHQEAEGITEEEVRDLVAKKDGLRQIIQSLLGPTSFPHYSARESSVSIFDRTDFHASLSDGQRVLLHLSVAIHAQGGLLGSSILFLDEPETHLHPAALIEVIDRIVAAIPNGQVWIATHCVPLIAHLVDRDRDCIWYAGDGQISHAARTPELIINGLLGSEGGAEKLKRFAELPAQHAANQFLSECLLPPSVAGANLDDPQSNQIADVLRNIHADSGSIRLLDYGAGQGRVLVTLQERSTNDLGEWLDYYAVEPSPETRPLLTETIRGAYPHDTTSRVFDSASNLANAKDHSSFDVVLLCNVLHEVDPDTWLVEFGRESRIAQVLSDRGYLLIVEDYGLPVGELANPAGFMLLNDAELRRLFSVREIDLIEKRFIRLQHPLPKYKDRLVAHLVHASLLQRVNASSRTDAIRELHTRMKEELRQLRQAAFQGKPATDYRAGLRYALCTQLAMNAALWLERQ